MLSKTARETRTSRGCLRALEEATGGVHGVEALAAVSQRLAETYGTRMWFVRILGHRWSYIAGCRPRTPALPPLERIPLAESNVGMVVETWGKLSPDNRRRLMAFLAALATREKLA